ncbi:TPA: hypothetical protein N0F65_006579, partial [Lagenidium giganteum]
MRIGKRTHDSPLFILPGKLLNRDVSAACEIPRARITTTESAFMDTNMMTQWIERFANEVPTPIQRPVVLLLNGASSHMDEAIDMRAKQLGVRLVQIPANASHLFQPLDVAVFRGLKSVLRQEINRFMLNTGKSGLTKKDEVSLASKAWVSGVVDKPDNIRSGFREAGIFPLSRPAMSRRLAKFTSNG